MPGASEPSYDSYSSPSTLLEQSSGNPFISSDGSNISNIGTVPSVGSFISAEPSLNLGATSTVGSHPNTASNLIFTSSPSGTGSVPRGGSPTDAILTSITGFSFGIGPISSRSSSSFGSSVGSPSSNSYNSNSIPSSSVGSVPNTSFTSNDRPATSQVSTLSTEPFSSVGSFSTPRSASSSPSVSISTSISSAIYSSDVSPISSPVISQLSSPSASPSRTTMTTPISSMVILSVELQALAAENGTKRGLNSPELWWAQLEGRQEVSPDMPDPDLSSGFVGNRTFHNPDNCTEASLYVQSRGRLQGSGRSLSVNPGVDYINIVDFVGGSISTLFSVLNGMLVWDNAAFYDGTARFCQEANGTVFALFTQESTPFNCTLVNLVVYTGELKIYGRMATLRT